jgi:hypothetical protein
MPPPAFVHVTDSPGWIEAVDGSHENPFAAIVAGVAEAGSPATRKAATSPARNGAR